MIIRDPARGKADLSNDTGEFLIFGIFKVKEEGLVALGKHNNLSFAVCNLIGDIKSGIARRLDLE